MRIVVGVIDAVTGPQTHLIVNQVSAMVGYGQEVALKLHTYVATIAVVLATAVAHTREF